VGPLERGLIVPPFAERLHEIGDGRTVNLGLYVVPRRSRAERRVEHFGLRVAFMKLVVAAPVAEVDATDEGQIFLAAGGVQEQHQLLVVRPAAPDTGVKEQDPAGIIHDASESAGLSFVESEHLRVGAPEEPSDPNPAARETGEQLVEARTARAKELIVVPPPIDEQHPVPRTEHRETTDEPREVGGPVDQRFDTVADGPGAIRLPIMVDGGRWIATLLRREEPFGRPLHPASLVMDDDLCLDAHDSLPRDDGVAVHLRLSRSAATVGAHAVTLEDAELAGDQADHP
jgi:hypothetical protein